MSRQELFSAVMALPDDERADLFDLLQGSLEPVSEEIDREWAATIARRREELVSGKVKGIPGDVVFAELRRKYGS